MTESDQLHAFILARLSTIEAVLALLWNAHPNREALKTIAATMIEARAATGLNSQTSDQELVVAALAQQQSFDAIFHELPQAQGCDPGRSV